MALGYAGDDRLEEHLMTITRFTARGWEDTPCKIE